MESLKKILLLSVIGIFICSQVFAQSGGFPRTQFEEVDGSPTGRPTTMKMDNGSLTDNGDGTFTHSIGAAGFVPYTGATANVDLGQFNLFCGDIFCYDPAGTDYITMYHDGTDGILGTNAGAVDIVPTTDVNVILSDALGVSTLNVLDSGTNNVFNVDSDGSVDFATGNIVTVPLSADINAYITAASSGDTLILGAGTYTITSNTTLSKKLHLKGQGKGITTIACSTNGVDMIVCSAEAGSLISDLTMTKSGAITTTAKFMITGSVSHNIENVEFIDTQTGGSVLTPACGTLTNGITINVRNCTSSQTGVIVAHSFVYASTGASTINVYDCYAVESGATSVATPYIISCMSGGTINCYNSTFTSSSNTANAPVRSTSTGYINCYNCVISGTGATAFDVMRSNGTITLYDTVLVNGKASGAISYGGTLETRRLGVGRHTSSALIQIDTLFDSWYANDGTKPTWLLSYNGAEVLNMFMGTSYKMHIAAPYSGASNGGLYFETGGLGDTYNRLTLTKAGLVGIGITNPTTAGLTIDSNSNVNCLRLLGADAANEIGDLWIDSLGGMVFDTIAGSDSYGYFDFHPGQDTGFGIVLRATNIASGPPYFNTTVIDTGTDYTNLCVSQNSTTLGLTIDANQNVGVATIPIDSASLTLFKNNSTANSFLIFCNSGSWDSDLQSIAWKDADDTVGRYIGGVGLRYDGGNSWTAMDWHSFYNGGYNSSVIMTLTPLGLGIGIEPATKLDIDSNSTTSALRIRSTDGANDYADLYVDADSLLWITTTTATKGGIVANHKFIQTGVNVTAAGPTDNVNVGAANVVFVSTASNSVTIGGFVGGVDGQVIHIVVENATNNTTLEHAEGTGNQDIYLSSGADETRTAAYGGWTLVCNGTNWYEVGQ